MNIEIDEKYKARLQQFAESSGRSIEEVVELAVDRILQKERPRRRREEPMSDEEHAAMMTEFERIRNLPLQSPDDGFSGRDHDNLIYRTDK